MASINVRRGELWSVKLDPVVGSESKKTRPCLVVQRDSANAVSPITIVCPVTAAGEGDGDVLNVVVPPGDTGLMKPSRVVCNQIRAVDVSRFRKRIGRLDPKRMASVCRGLRLILDV